MRAKPFLVLALALVVSCAPGLASACRYPGGRPSQGPTDIDNTYREILGKHRVGPGEIGKLAGKQGEADVRFAVTYEAREDVKRRQRQVEDTLSRLDESLKTTRRALQAAKAGLQDAAAATPSDPQAPRLDADDKSALAEMVRRLDAMERKLLDKTKPLQDQWQALGREGDALSQRLRDMLSSVCPAEVAAASIGGIWTAMNTTYTIIQTGSTFTWTNPGLGGETAKGSIDGTKIKAEWKGGRFGDGSGSGTIVIEGGRAVRIHWGNGVVFLRK